MVEVHGRHSFLWKNKLKSFIDKINKVHPTIKFIAEWSKTLSISWMSLYL